MISKEAGITILSTSLIACITVFALYQIKLLESNIPDTLEIEKTWTNPSNSETCIYGIKTFQDTVFAGHYLSKDCNIKDGTYKLTKPKL